MQSMPPSSFSYSWDYISWFAFGIADMVSGNVVGNQPEERCKCAWPKARVRLRQLRNRMDDVAQITTGDG